MPCIKKIKKSEKYLKPPALPVFTYICLCVCVHACGREHEYLCVRNSFVDEAQKSKEKSIIIHKRKLYNAIDFGSEVLIPLEKKERYRDLRVEKERKEKGSRNFKTQDAYSIDFDLIVRSHNRSSFSILGKCSFAYFNIFESSEDYLHVFRLSPLSLPHFGSATVVPFLCGSSLWHDIASHS